MIDTNHAPPARGPGLDIAGGSVVGAEHRRAGRPNQDAFAWTRVGGGLVAVVCDGCGSGRASEVGAHIGARAWATALARRLGSAGPAAGLAEPGLWRRVMDDVLLHLRVLARGMGSDLAAVVADYFLFTVVGAAITPELTAVYSIGDGVVAVGADVTTIGPFPGNRPPYLAYELLGDHVEIDVHCLTPTHAVDSIVLASDGAADLGDALPLARLAADDGVFDNPDALRRRLAQVNRERVVPDWERRRLVRSRGILGDDTTVVAIRRRAAVSEAA